MEVNLVVIREALPLEILENVNSDYLFDCYAQESKGSLIPTHKPDKELYLRLYETGALMVLGVFDQDKLVGFMSGITSIMPHYGEPATTIESIFVLKEYRGNNTGKKLIQKMEEICSTSVAMFISSPVNGVLGKYIGRLGYEETTRVFTKKLK